MQPKLVLALRGVSNTGKTETLNHLIDKFNVKSKVVYKHDKRVICEYRGVDIAITTAGDNQMLLEENVNFFKRNSCEIAITAVRTRGTTNEIIEAYATEVGAELKYINISRVEASMIESKIGKYINILIQEIDNYIDNRKA